MNVAYFFELISSVSGLGKAYNPSLANIKLNALQPLSARANKAIDRVNAAFPAYSSAIAARDAAFSKLNQMTSRIINALKTTDTNTLLEQNVLIYARKIQGRGAISKNSGEEIKANVQPGKETVRNSASQMSFDSRLDNFDKLIKLLSGVEAYSPSEDDLKVITLTAFYNELDTKNKNAVTATVPLSNARIERNNILYRETTGLLDIASDVKTYIKSVFGERSPQYQQVSRLKFTRLA